MNRREDGKGDGALVDFSPDSAISIGLKEEVPKRQQINERILNFACWEEIFKC